MIPGCLVFVISFLTSITVSVYYLQHFERSATEGATIREHNNQSLIEHITFTRWITLSYQSNNFHLASVIWPKLIADSAAVAVGSSDFVLHLEDQPYQAASPGHLCSCSQIHSAAAAALLPYWVHLQHPCQTLQWHHKILISVTSNKRNFNQGNYVLWIINEVAAIKKRPRKKKKESQ